MEFFQNRPEMCPSYGRGEGEGEGWVRLKIGNSKLVQLLSFWSPFKASPKRVPLNNDAPVSHCSYNWRSLGCPNSRTEPTVQAPEKETKRLIRAVHRK